MIVVHAVRSHVFAGVERYVASVAPRLAARGVDVRVIGGDPVQMQNAAGANLQHTRAATTSQVARALVRNGRADVVHVHMTAAEIAGVLTAPRHRGAIVSTRHFAGPRGTSAGGHLTAPLIRGRLAQQISVSHFVADAIGEPSMVLANGVERREAGQHGSNSVVVLQRLEREKETDLALRAWSAANARSHGWTLEVIGDGALRPDLVALAQSLGISGTVRFAGHVTDAASRLAAAGILLAPARGEPFGFSVVEAMAAATPVVAAAGGGHLETVGSCDNARVFKPGDAADCAAHLDGLVADEAERRKYGLALQAHQRSRFDIDVHIDELLGLYERLL
ncbi:MAG: hypothetical protein QOF21_1308 [Actinomycetota bacterium]